jgi:prevent-host-death family protein
MESTNMKTVGIRELKEHLSEVLREVQDGTIIEVTNRGQIIARVVPVRRQAPEVSKIRAQLADIDRLAAEISAHWPTGVSALDAVEDARGDH